MLKFLLNKMKGLLQLILKYNKKIIAKRIQFYFSYLFLTFDNFFYLMTIIEGDLILFFFINMGHFFKEVKNNFSDSIDAF